jgi:hypothetical protein
MGKGVDSPENCTTQEGPVVISAGTSGETSVGMVKLGEAIEKPCSYVLAHSPKVCKGI